MQLNLPTSQQRNSNAYDTNANVVPNVIRALMGLVVDRGFSPERLCRGLGFEYQDLLERDVRLSYRQIQQLLSRAKNMLADPELGFSVGKRQSPVSWGVSGLAMLTCETFGEAISFGVEHQNDVGAMLEHLFSIDGKEMTVEICPKYADRATESFLIEEAFSSAVSIARHLIGEAFCPLRVDLTYPKTAYAATYQKFFRCPVHFGADSNRLVCDVAWLSVRLPSYDKITCGLLRKQLSSLLEPPVGRNDIFEFVNSRLHVALERPRTIDQVAKEVNMSERSLRRRLDEQQVSYRELLNQARFERAQDLLTNTKLNIAEIARNVGYADVRSFRRAFKRWSSGTLPSQVREKRVA